MVRSRRADGWASSVGFLPGRGWHAPQGASGDALFLRCAVRQCRRASLAHRPPASLSAANLLRSEASSRRMMLAARTLGRVAPSDGRPPLGRCASCGRVDHACAEDGLRRGAMAPHIERDVSLAIQGTLLLMVTADAGCVPGCCRRPAPCRPTRARQQGKWASVADAGSPSWQARLP